MDQLIKKISRKKNSIRKLLKRTYFDKGSKSFFYIHKRKTKAIGPVQKLIETYRLSQQKPGDETRLHGQRKPYRRRYRRNYQTKQDVAQQQLRSEQIMQQRFRQMMQYQQNLIDNELQLMKLNPDYREKGLKNVAEIQQEMKRLHDADNLLFENQEQIKDKGIKSIYNYLAKLQVPERKQILNTMDKEVQQKIIQSAQQIVQPSAQQRFTPGGFLDQFEFPDTIMENSIEYSNEKLIQNKPTQSIREQFLFPSQIGKHQSVKLGTSPKQSMQQSEQKMLSGKASMSQPQQQVAQLSGSMSSYIRYRNEKQTKPQDMLSMNEKKSALQVFDQSSNLDLMTPEQIDTAFGRLENDRRSMKQKHQSVSDLISNDDDDNIFGDGSEECTGDGVELRQALSQLHVFIDTVGGEWQLLVCVDDNISTESVKCQKNYIILILENEHYRCCVYNNDESQLWYFDPLAKNYQHDLQYIIRPFLLVCDPETMAKVKFNSNATQSDESSLCFFHCMTFLHNVIVCGESYAESTEFDENDPELQKISFGYV